MKQRQFWLRIRIFLFVGLIVSVITIACFFGLKGEHWIIDFMPVLADVLFFSLTFGLLLYWIAKHKRLPSKSIKKKISRLCFGLVLLFLTYCLSIGPALKLAGVKAPSNFDNLPTLLKYTYYPLFHCEYLNVLMERYLILWIC